MTEPGTHHQETGRYIPMQGGSRSRLLLDASDRHVPGDPSQRYTYPGHYESVVLKQRITTLTGHHGWVPRRLGLFDII